MAVVLDRTALVIRNRIIGGLDILRIGGLVQRALARLHRLPSSERSAAYNQDQHHGDNADDAQHTFALGMAAALLADKHFAVVRVAPRSRTVAWGHGPLGGELHVIAGKR